jgi:fatty-acyl-CoA synthase
MMNGFLQILAAARGGALADLPARVRTAARIARQTGIAYELTLPGLRAVLATLGGPSPGPSQVYEFHAKNSPDKVALQWVETDGAADGPVHRMTYAQLNERMNRAGSALQRRGVGRGASVVLMMRNRPEFLEVQAAAGRIGAAAVSVSWRSTASELAFVANDSGAKAVVFDHDLWPVIDEARRTIGTIAAEGYVAVGGSGVSLRGCDRYEEDFLTAAEPAPREMAPGDGAVVVYTSGTTGKPKGAVRKFPKEALYAVLDFIAETPMRADDVHFVACPLYHATAFGFASMTGVLGGCCVLAGEFRPQAFLDYVERLGVTTTAVVPTMLHRVLALGPAVLAAHDTRSLRLIMSGGAPLPGPLALRTMDQFGDVLFNFYGATETGLVTLAKPADLRAAPGTIGKPLPGNEIRLLDDAGREVPPGDVGELYVRNRLLLAGYHGNPEATRASMRDGFFSVGDLARRTPDGRYFIEGRKRDMIISGGVNVYPAEVEAVLEAHADIAEAAVVGVDDAEWGERVRAFVVRRPSSHLDEAAVTAWCRQKLAGPKLPRDVVFVDALPRNPTGKVLKRELRARGTS